MTTSLPARLDEDSLPIILAKSGTPFIGDGQLHLLARMPLRPNDTKSVATVQTQTQNVGNYAVSDSVLITNELVKRKAAK